MTDTTLAHHKRTFLNLLNAKQVEYLVIGGHAVAYHGYQRLIADLDVWVATHKSNTQKIVAVLHALGHGLPAEAEAFFQLPERVIRIGTPPFRIERFRLEDRFIHLGTQPPQVEVMTSISGVEFAQCYAERVAGYLDGILVSMISLACLRANKRASIRPKDADDYEHLMESTIGPSASSPTSAAELGR
jgi:hypothetical protein